jgi:penicillin-insensitive murein endopeptidase
LQPRAIDRYNAAVRVPLLTAITTIAVATSPLGAGNARGDDTEAAVPGGLEDTEDDAVDEGDELADDELDLGEESLQPELPAPPALIDGWSHDHGSSISCGAANRGALYGGVPLPHAGIGYAMPEPWLSRGHHYGTEELVGLITRAAAAVDQTLPGGVLGVADLSGPEGGVLRGHRSHQSGRDVDLIYYSIDPAGHPFPPDHYMAYYTHSGLAHYARSPSFSREIAQRYFDLARNWALVKVLLTDRRAEVEHIFVSSRVRHWLLDFARHSGEPEELVSRAARVLRKPRGVDGHNDHMHVRIRCSEDDAALGRCRNDNASRPRRGRRWRSVVTCPAPLVSMQ